MALEFYSKASLHNFYLEKIENLQMEVSTIANLMKLSNEKLIRKAEEFVRLAAIRCPGGLGTVIFKF